MQKKSSNFFSAKKKCSRCFMIMLMFGFFAHLLGLKYAKLCSFYTRVVRNCAWCRQFRDSSPLLMWSRKVSCLASTRTVTFSGVWLLNLG